MGSPCPVPRLIARSILSLGILACRLLSRAKRNRGFIAGSPPPILAAIEISLLSLAKILARLASIAPLKCLTFAHLLCPAIRFSFQYVAASGPESNGCHSRRQAP